MLFLNVPIMTSFIFRYFNPIKLIQDFRVSIGVKVRSRKLRRLRMMLKNEDFTMLTENCLAGIVYHDFGMQFRSPLINGEFSTEDYIKFLQNPKYYMQQELVFVSNKDENLPVFYRELDCPVACVGDLHFRFTHYHMSEDEIRVIWDKRRDRINWDNLFVVLCEKKGCTIEHMKLFEALPYKHKLILTCHHYPELEYVFHVKGFEEIGYIDNLLKNMSGFLPATKKYYDQFDFVVWLNTGKIQRS